MDHNYKAYFGIVHDINEDLLDKEYINDIIHGILNNMFFCYYIFSKYKDDDKYNLCHFCISKLISCEYINYELIEKYKPIFFNFYNKCSYRTTISLIEKYDWLRYSLGINLILQHNLVSYNNLELIKKYIPLPEYNVINYCIKYNNREAYDYYVEECTKINGIYKIYDLNKFIYLKNMEIIDIKYIPKWENFEKIKHGFDKKDYIKTMKDKINNCF